MAGGIEGGAEADRLREFGGSIHGDAVQRLAPPVVGGDVEARNGARLIDQLRGFLFERHPVYQIGGALLGGQSRIQICGLLRILRESHIGCGT